MSAQLPLPGAVHVPLMTTVRSSTNSLLLPLVMLAMLARSKPRPLIAKSLGSNPVIAPEDMMRGYWPLGRLPATAMSSATVPLSVMPPLTISRSLLLGVMSKTSCALLSNVRPPTVRVPMPPDWLPEVLAPGANAPPAATSTELARVPVPASVPFSTVVGPVKVFLPSSCTMPAPLMTSEVWPPAVPSLMTPLNWLVPAVGANVSVTFVLLVLVTVPPTPL